MTCILLTGAGFSRNWGGWLANEAFEYLLGCPEIDAGLRDRLWKSKAHGGGFEEALADLQEEHMRRKDTFTEKPLKDFQAALVRMFNEMDQAFSTTTFEPQSDTRYLVRSLLVRFDAIFTLNQDLLLERHYLDDNITLSQVRRWNGWQTPGLKLLNPSPHTFDPNGMKAALRTPDGTQFQEQGGLQPYFKLHGSSNWISDAGERLLIMGGNKAVDINQHPLLRWYHQKFAEHLARANARLMVIGYSFTDHHINEAIMKAAEKGNLSLFIIDPQGVDVLNKQNPLHIKMESPLMARLNPHIVGASRRPLTASFGNDRVEHGKIMRFLGV